MPKLKIDKGAIKHVINGRQNENKTFDDRLF